MIAHNEKLRWYHGPTLIQRIREVSASKNESDAHADVLIGVDRLHETGSPGVVFTGKILHGSLRRGSALLIAPMISAQGQPIVGTGVVHKIKAKDEEPISIAREGAMVGVELRKLSPRGGSFPERTVIAVSPGATVKIGNLVELKCTDSDVKLKLLEHRAFVVWEGDIR